MAPKRLPIRPTTDMAKEGLFNILNNHFYFDEISVLDLFAGSGNISYEFASRGTKKITAVDIDHGCALFITKTSKTLEMGIMAVKNDVYTFLEKTNVGYDIIFADPPYSVEQANFEKIRNLVFENDLLLPHGKLIIEHSKKTDLSHLHNFESKRKYGNSVFSFFGTEVDGT